MTIQRLEHAATPLPASAHNVWKPGGVDAVTMLTIYIVLLYAIPSNLSIAFLGSFGRPQFLWGIVLLVWWILSRVQASGYAVRATVQPVRLALGILIVICLLSFAQALLRGQPLDQISPAVSAVARLLSWSGVALVAMDGIRTMDDLMKMIRRVALAGGLVAMLGLAQFVTDLPIIDFLSAVPGFSGDVGGVDSRGAFTRPAGTATHPLEYATAISVALPLAIACAIVGQGGRQQLRWWIPVGAVTLASFLAVSRSAVIGFIVAIIAAIPGLPKRYRATVLVIVVIVALGAVLAVPGLYGTILGMFLGIGSDSSSQSRSAGLELAPIFVAASPILGAGVGTFLPRYYIFDNQWIQMIVEIGVLGVASFAALLACAIWSAWHASRVSGLEDLRVVGRALSACVATIAVLFALFDGLAFPISAGVTFLLVGLCAAARTVGMSDALLDRARWLPSRK